MPAHRYLLNDTLSELPLEIEVRAEPARRGGANAAGARGGLEGTCYVWPDGLGAGGGTCYGAS